MACKVDNNWKPPYSINVECYFPFICNKCKETPDELQSPLKRCSECKVAYYCSKQHQRLDWADHRGICRPTSAYTTCDQELMVTPSKIPALLNSLPPNAIAFNKMKMDLWNVWEAELNRKLKPTEMHMWMFQNACAVCFDRITSVTCPRCWSVSFCSEEHQADFDIEHQKFCSELRLFHIFNRFIIRMNPKELEISDEVRSLPPDMRSVMECIGVPHPPIDNSLESTMAEVTYRAYSSLLCPGINIAFALQCLGFLKNRMARKTDLVIHVVNEIETGNRMPWEYTLEFLIKWIKNLESIDLYCVGKAAFHPISDIWSERNPRRVKVCTPAIDKPYNEVYDELKKPDIVCVFNGGLHWRPVGSKTLLWEDSIPKLIHHLGVPFLLTAPNGKQMARYIECMIRCFRLSPNTGYGYYVKPQKNPYADLLPLRNWKEKVAPVYYESDCVAVLFKYKTSHS